MKPLMIMFMNALGLAWLGLKDFRWLPFFGVCLSQVLFFISMRRMRVHPMAAFAIVLVLIHLIFQDRFHDKILNDVETYGVAFSAMAFACLHGHVFTDGRRWRWFAKFMGGMFAGMAINSKEPFVFIVLPLIAANYFFEEHFSSEERKTASIFVVAGISAVFVLLWGYLLYHGALGAYFHVLKGSMIYARHYAQDLGVFTGGSFLEVVRFSISKLAAGYQNGLFLFRWSRFILRSFGDGKGVRWCGSVSEAFFLVCMRYPWDMLFGRIII
jgi:hypothetical protein